MNEQRELTSLHGIGTLSTIGYAHPAAPPQIERLMQQERTMLLDIRSCPYARWAWWKQPALMHRYEQRSRWERRLGNLNSHHQERGIEQAEGHGQAVEHVASMLFREPRSSCCAPAKMRVPDPWIRTRHTQHIAACERMPGSVHSSAMKHWISPFPVISLYKQLRQRAGNGEIRHKLAWFHSSTQPAVR